MRSTAALLVVGLGIVLLWLAATGRLDNLANAWSAIKGQAPGATGAGVKPASSSGSSLGALPLGSILSLLPPIGLPAPGAAPALVTTPGPVNA